MNRLMRLLLAVCCVLALTVGGAGVGAAQQEVRPGEGHFLVELEANGNASVEYTREYNLSNPDQRATFEAVRDNETLRSNAETKFQEEMQFISDAANERIDREMRVGEVTITTETDGDTGVVAYRFRWENVARVDGDRVVLVEPFSIYDELDRELVVVAPDGYELASVTPEAESRNATHASWSGFTPLEGFEVVAEATGEAGGTDSEATDGDGAGFGVGVAVTALAAAALLARRHG